MIEIQNLSYLNILHNINIEIDNNLTILGENGAGKSTLARLICGLIDTNNIKTDKKDINYIPPILNIYDENLTLIEYLESAFYTKNINHEAIEKVLKIVGLQNKKIIYLSSGQKQLAQIAIALLQDKKVTIFDEPTANLDPRNIKKVFDILKNNFQYKLIITHDLNFAYNLGYDILFLEKGEIAFFGSCEKFFKSNFYADVLMIDKNGVMIKL